MSPSNRSDSSDDLETPQAYAIDSARSMTEPRAAERTPPLEISTSIAHSPTSPTSPPFSPLTPPPICPISSPMGMAHDENRPMVGIVLADPETMLGEKSAAVYGDAEVLVNQPTESDHDRTKEFENHTMQARKVSRKDCAEDFQQNSPGPKMQPKGEATPSRDQIMPQEQRPEAQNEGEDLPEPKAEVTPSRTQAKWVSEVVTACRSNKRNPLSQGDVLVILDTADLTRSCLLDSNALCRASSVLEEIYKNAQVTSSGCVSEQGLDGMFVLSAASMPELVPAAIDASLESMSPQQSKDHHPPARSTRSAKIKAESDQGESPPAASDDAELPKTDRIKAYESFFRIVAGKKHGISKNDLSTALPQIQGVVEIAQKYSAIDAIQSTFVGLLLGYVENHTLYSTIAKWPAHCLNLGVALRSRLVYDEAFKHLVGDGANFKNGKVSTGLSDDVQAIVQRRSRELYSARRDAEEKLMLMTLTGNKKDGDCPSQFVSQHDQHMAYNTVNIFRDWINEHIGHLRKETKDEPAPFYLCDHTDGCDDVAGFYHAIVSYDYLDPEEVYENFSSHYKSSSEARQKTELEAVRQALEQLKDSANAYVEKLSESTLHLADRSGLRYLTCVKVVEAEDVPWYTGSDEDSCDGEMDEDSD